MVSVEQSENRSNVLTMFGQRKHSNRQTPRSNRTLSGISPQRHGMKLSVGLD